MMNHTYMRCRGAAATAKWISLGLLLLLLAVGVKAVAQVDTDGDGMSDDFELAYGLDPLDSDQDSNGIIDGQDDFDDDGLANSAEELAGTDPLQPDTDSDGLLDGDELGRGFFGPPRLISTASGSPQSVADLDGDGDVDILLASSGITWCENTDGAGSFGPRQVISTNVDDVVSVLASDLDGDGDLDVLSASSGDRKLAWYENIDGAGNFGPQQVISTFWWITSVVVADLDGDDDPDVVFSAAYPDQVGWWENAGMGDFGSMRRITSDFDRVASVFASDLDGDRDMDVLLASPWDDEIAWYENLDGAGDFGPQQTLSIDEDDPSFVMTSDLDGDGDQDVLSAADDTGLSWYENLDGAGSFGPRQVIALDDHHRRLFPVDMDRDDDVDVLSRSGRWYENSGTGSFGLAHLVEDGPFGLTFAADLDGDGDPDVPAGGDGIVWYENINTDPLDPDTDDDGLLDGFEVAHDLDPLDSDIDDDGLDDGLEIKNGLDPFDDDSDDDGLLDGFEYAIGLDGLDADSDDDGLLDWFELRNGLDALDADQDGNGVTDRDDDFDDDGLSNIDEQAVQTDPMDVDTDSDDLLDGVEVAGGLDPVNPDSDWDRMRDGFEFVNGFDPLHWDENGNGIVDGQDDADQDGLGNEPEHAASTDPNDADTDDDALLDGEEVGRGSFGAAIQIADRACRPIIAVDIDGDGDFDALCHVYDPAAWYVTLFENTDGAGSFGPGVVLPIAIDSLIDVVDMDGDGDIDVLGETDSSVGDDKVAWYENLDGSDSFSQEHVIAIGADLAFVRAADLDSDGDMDVLAHSRFPERRIVWYENRDGFGNFGSGQVIWIGSRAGQYAADLDDDGDVDILSLYAGRLAWLENTDGTGEFRPPREILTDYEIDGFVLVADINGDGQNDLIAQTDHWYFENRIEWFPKTDGDFGSPDPISGAINRLGSLSVADVDGDGDLDVLTHFAIPAGSEADGPQQEIRPPPPRPVIAWYENSDGTGLSFWQKHIITESQLASHRCCDPIAHADLDGDGDLDVLGEPYEIMWYENQGLADPLDPDSDDDGLGDGDEVERGSDALDPDTDDDAAVDGADNCLLDGNPDQRDSNSDEFGNICDADLDNDCAVNFDDLVQMRTVFLTGDPDADLNGDGTVNFVDLGIMKARFLRPPGPTGLPSDCGAR